MRSCIHSAGTYPKPCTDRLVGGQFMQYPQHQTPFPLCAYVCTLRHRVPTPIRSGAWGKSPLPDGVVVLVVHGANHTHTAHPLAHKHSAHSHLCPKTPLPWSHATSRVSLAGCETRRGIQCKTTSARNENSKGPACAGSLHMSMGLRPVPCLYVTPLPHNGVYPAQSHHVNWAFLFLPTVGRT